MKTFIGAIMAVVTLFGLTVGCSDRQDGRVTWHEEPFLKVVAWERADAINHGDLADVWVGAAPGVTLVQKDGVVWARRADGTRVVLPAEVHEPRDAGNGITDTIQIVCYHLVIDRVEVDFLVRREKQSL